MATKTYRLKVRKIPIPDDIIYKKLHFPAFQELHLDLLENKNKLKKNPPKPIFIRNEPKETVSKHADHVDEDFTLEELERAYKRDDIDNDDVFSDREEKEPIDDEPKNNGEYQQEEFKQEEEEEEDEEERERRKKSDLLFKFMVLRRQYPNVEIPEFTEHSDINTMERVYEQIIRRVSLDSSVDDYKQYLVGGFMVLEWVSTNWLSIDLGGFTKQQGQMMNRYERLLIELGEKNYSSMGSRFPVEVRLIFLIIFNAGLFYVQKMIFSGGGNVLNLFGDMNAQPQQAAAPHRRQRTRGMRGPTITPQDVEDFTRRQQDTDDDDESDHDKEA